MPSKTNKLVVVSILAALASATCFTNMWRYPKLLQSQTNKADSRWRCIETQTSAKMNAIFLGGYVSKSNGLATSLPTNSIVPVIARINGDTNLFQFQMAYGATAESKLE